MAKSSAQKLFRASSQTYYFSSLFFPEPIKSDVITLYAYVRTADNLVDQQPADRAGFEQLVAETWHLLTGAPLIADPTRSPGGDTAVAALNPVVANFADLALRKGFELHWIKAFLQAMALDLGKSRYITLDETKHYMYGSAEVIGLMLARIFDLPEASYRSARLLGRAMQFINMVRDVAEDVQLGRWYLPVSEYAQFGLPGDRLLNEEIAKEHPAAFRAYMRAQLSRQMTWMMEASQGFGYLPRSLRIPVQTASEMYDWTASEIWKEPQRVWQGSVKPSTDRVLATGFMHTLMSWSTYYNLIIYVIFFAASNNSP